MTMASMRASNIVTFPNGLASTHRYSLSADIGVGQAVDEVLFPKVLHSRIKYSNDSHLTIHFELLLDR